jgi:ADP-ribosylarginine hydrolase
MGGKLKNFIDCYVAILPELEDKKRVSGVITLNSLRMLAKYKDPSKISYSDKMGGNGAAMRTHYIGIHFRNDIDAIIKKSIESSRLTHNYPMGFLGGMTTAVFTSYAINGIEPWKWCDMLIELNDKIDSYMKTTDIYDKYMKDKTLFWNSWYSYREKRMSNFGVQTSETLFGTDRYTSLIKAIYVEKTNNFEYSAFGGNGSSSTIVAYDSLLSCIISKDGSPVLDLDNPSKLVYRWETLVFNSTLHFGDNDTTGAIAGGWYGALRGFDGVNINIEQLEFKKQLV